MYRKFSKAMIAKAVENPVVYIPNWRFQTADCKSALPGFGKYVDAPIQEGNSDSRFVCMTARTTKCKIGDVNADSLAHSIRKNVQSPAGRLKPAPTVHNS